MYKKQIVLITLITFLTVSFIFLYNKNSTNKENNELQQKSPIEYINCNEINNNLMIGVWKYPGGSFPTNPEIKFTSNQEFTLSNWSDAENSILGSWKLDNSFIILKFDELNSYWNEFLQQPINEYFGDDFNVDYIDKTLSLPIGYFERQEDKEEMCKSENFYINFFNVLLYKTIN